MKATNLIFAIEKKYRESAKSCEEMARNSTMGEHRMEMLQRQSIMEGVVADLCDLRLKLSVEEDK